MKSLFVHLFALAAISGALAQENTSQLKFSDPGKPGTLKVNLMGGTLRIVGSDTTEVTVVSDAKSTSQKRSDGLRVLSASTSFSLDEKNNVATLDAGYGRHHGTTSSFKITVPKNTAVVVNNQYGDTVCSDLGGDVEVHSANGAVTLRNIAAGASIETQNGAIRADVQTLLPDHALCFSSMNGEIMIHLPESSKANLQLRTQNGTILTDFDDKDLVAKATSSGLSATSNDDFRKALRHMAETARDAARTAREAAQGSLSEAGGSSPSIPPIPPLPPLPPLPPMTGGQTVSGVLHGGGTSVQASTMNGDVTVRKK
jgi:DUF4097 and DUF4098 domain-containing protein YvlB